MFNSAYKWFISDDPDWFGSDPNCYKMIYEPATNEEASRICNEMGSDLVGLDTMTTGDNFVINEINRKPWNRFGHQLFACMHFLAKMIIGRAATASSAVKAINYKAKMD